MNAYCNGVEFGQIHCRNLEILKNDGLKKFSGNFEGIIELNEQCLSACQWWIDNASICPKLIDHGNPHVILYTDASTGSDNSFGGWGANRNGENTGGRWSIEESGHDINVLEILGCYFGLKSLCRNERKVQM